MDNQQIKEEARIYLSGEKTVSSTASQLGISKRTLQIHFKKLKEIDEDLHSLVIKKQESNMKRGRIKGGQIGKRNPSLSEEKTIELANDIINHQYTYKEAEEISGIPSSTIYERTHSTEIDQEIIDKLNLTSAANQKGITTEEYVERHKKI